MGCNREFVPFGVTFFLAVAVYIVGASLPYWFHHKDSYAELYLGSFRACTKTYDHSVCVSYPTGNWVLYNWAAAAGIVLSIIAAILILVWTVGSKKSVGTAGKSLGICAGICGIVSVIHFGVLIHWAGYIPNGFAYYITAAGATWLALQSVIGLCMRFPEPQQGNQGNTQQMTYVVQPGQQYVIPGVQPGQQYVNPGVQPGQQYVNPGVQPGQQYVNPGVQPGQQYVNPGVQPGQQFVNPGFAATPADKATNPPAYSPGY